MQMSHIESIDWSSLYDYTKSSKLFMETFDNIAIDNIPITHRNDDENVEFLPQRVNYEEVFHISRFSTLRLEIDSISAESESESEVQQDPGISDFYPLSSSHYSREGQESNGFTSQKNVSQSKYTKTVNKLRRYHRRKPRTTNINMEHNH